MNRIKFKKKYIFLGLLAAILVFILTACWRTMCSRTDVAFVNYQRPIFETEQVAAICGREIVQYQFHNHQDLEQLAAQVKADGCTVYVGGAEGVKYILRRLSEKQKENKNK